jgi:hypothetical protein
MDRIPGHAHRISPQRDNIPMYLFDQEKQLQCSCRYKVSTEMHNVIIGQIHFYSDTGRFRVQCSSFLRLPTSSKACCNIKMLQRTSCGNCLIQVHSDHFMSLAEALRASGFANLILALLRVSGELGVGP